MLHRIEVVQHCFKLRTRQDDNDETTKVHVQGKECSHREGTLQILRQHSLWTAPYLTYSDVNRIICKERGLMDGGS